MNRVGLLCLCVASALWAGCTERIVAVPPDAQFGDSGPGDGGSIFDSGTDSGRDAARGDTGTQPDASGAGLQCSACTTEADCAAGDRCVLLAAGQRVCLANCMAEIPTCPHRFDCLASALTPEVGLVCTPVGERCCVDGDEDDRGTGVGCRGADCDDSNPNVYEGATETCNGVDDNCDGNADEGNPGGGLVCSTGMSGACSSGVTTCTSGAIVCQPNASTMSETCNGMDDDCDGNVDEDASHATLTQPCYDGAAGTMGVGICVAGVQTCVGGMFRGCIGQIQPAAELCNGVDDDCDGTIDDGNPGGGLACSTGFGGACDAGALTCMAGAVRCVPTLMPGTNPEICDNLDNDCDGMLNEGFPGLGTACTSGLGSCLRGGVTICNPANPASAPICSAVPGTPSAVEQCDYVDDNCNGTIDEGYRNASGIYDTVTNCGACGVNCNNEWVGGAAAYNVTPTCTPSGTTALCGFTCVAGAFDADGFRDNGCEFFPEPDTIYVSTPANGGADVSGCGTYSMPCGTIGGGILRATSSSTYVRVRVSTGLFVENVTLANGISVIGGHSHTNWVHNPAVFASAIRGSDTPSAAGGPTDRITVTAIGINSARTTELSGFTIESVSAGAGGNSIGVYVRDSTSTLLIQDNEIVAGPGGSGAAGSPGAPGTSGVIGATGRGPLHQVCTSAATPAVAGGVRSCGATSVNGGAGASATNPTTTSAAPTRQPSGTTGSTALGGAGGLGGYNMLGTTMGTRLICQVYATPTDGAVGAVGTSGNDGAGGAGAASATGTIASFEWRGISGMNGAGGGNGGGGGGGGSSAGVYEGTNCLFPPTGGGGGSGGCAGTAGLGGTAGGASFAIFMVFTTTPTTATMPNVRNNSLRRGLGGRGGDGGTGGGGGEGGHGGAGGPTTLPAGQTDNYTFCLSPGAVGGDGGRGGHAGGGGGGAGGVSYDIWISRPGSAAPDYTMNTFEVPATTATAGTGGAGGNSSNTSIGLGTVGIAGTFGTIRIGT